MCIFIDIYRTHTLGSLFTSSCFLTLATLPPSLGCHPSYNLVLSLLSFFNILMTLILTSHPLLLILLALVSLGSMMLWYKWWPGKAWRSLQKTDKTALSLCFKFEIPKLIAVMSEYLPLLLSYSLVNTHISVHKDFPLYSLHIYSNSKKWKRLVIWGRIW